MIFYILISHLNGFQPTVFSPRMSGRIIIITLKIQIDEIQDPG